MTLHPQSQAFLDATRDAPRWNELPVDESRRRFGQLTELFGTGPELPSVTDHQIDDRIPVRIYRVDADESRPGVMYFHGGGWVIGDLDSHDTVCRRLAVASDCTVIAVDYRLAPEHTYPAALNDCYDATVRVFDQPETFGVTKGKLAVAGDSAGGHLAAGVCVRARDEHHPRLALQVLIYPIIDHSLETLSYEDFAEGFGLSREMMGWFWKQYVPGPLPEDDPRLTPARAMNLGGLPPAHVVTAEYDVLRDEAESYAARLAKAGVPTTRQRYDGMLHGFIHFLNAYDDGDRAIGEIGQVIRQHFE